MPNLSTLGVDHRSTTRRLLGGRATPLAIALAAVVIVAGGCIAEDTLLSSAPSSSPSTAIPSGSRAAPSAGAPADSPGSPSPIPNLVPIEVRNDAVTVICESWGGELPPSTIDCGDAVALGLAALGGERAASVRRLEFRFGAPCNEAPCAERRPDVGWVLARSASFDSLVVRLELDADGGLQAWPPIDGPVLPDPVFRPPAVDAPDLGKTAPKELRDREPLPFCGDESMIDPEAFDTPARTCFLNGVLSGTPVELLSREWSTEGQQVTKVYRFLGHGGVLHYVQAEGRWTVLACGIGPIDTPAVFLLAGSCGKRREL
ncbi:MAG TPA: hypothetical protein VGJ71_02920 [Candidatus Limnocylindrales bacterium]